MDKVTITAIGQLKEADQIALAAERMSRVINEAVAVADRRAAGERGQTRADLYNWIEAQAGQLLALDALTLAYDDVIGDLYVVATATRCANWAGVASMLRQQSHVFLIKAAARVAELDGRPAEMARVYVDLGAAGRHDFVIDLRGRGAVTPCQINNVFHGARYIVESIEMIAAQDVGLDVGQREPVGVLLSDRAPVVLPVDVLTAELGAPRVATIDARRPDDGRVITYRVILAPWEPVEAAARVVRAQGAGRAVCGYADPARAADLADPAVLWSLASTPWRQTAPDAAGAIETAPACAGIAQGAQIAPDVEPCALDSVPACDSCPVAERSDADPGQTCQGCPALDLGEPDDNKPAVIQSDQIDLLCDSHHGVYIPQIMAPRLLANNWQGIDADDAAQLEQGPENEFYWETWERILNNATWRDLDNPTDDRVWCLHHDGDLFAVSNLYVHDEE